MKRREFVKSLICSGALLSLPGCISASGLSGGGGSADWESIVNGFSGGLKKIANQAVNLTFVKADLADALGLTQAAALSRGEAKELEEKGDALGAADLDAHNEKSASTDKLINDKLKEATNLSAQQKEKIANAAKDYSLALIGAVVGASEVSKAATSASGAGAPSATTNPAILDVALGIPDLAPAAISFVAKSVESGNALFEVMNEKDISTPAPIEMDMV